MKYQSFLNVAIPWVRSALIHVVAFFFFLLVVPLDSVLPTFGLACFACSMAWVAGKFTEKDDEDD